MASNMFMLETVKPMFETWFRWQEELSRFERQPQETFEAWVKRRHEAGERMMDGIN